MDIVDTIVHPISTDEVRYPPSPGEGERLGWSTGRRASIEEFAALSRAAGVTQTVLVHSFSTYGYDNAYVVDAAASDPERFVPVGSVDPLAPDVVDQMAYWVGDRGLQGIRYPHVDLRVFDAGHAAAWRAPADLGIPLLFHSRETPFAVLGAVLDANPDLVVVGDHLLNPPIDDGPPFERAASFLELAVHPNLYVKVTNANLTHFNRTGHTSEFLKRVVDAFGPERIMWGSNYPSAYHAAAENPYLGVVEEARRALGFLDEAGALSVFAATARAVYTGLTQ